MSQPKICPQCNREYEEQHLFCTIDGASLVTVAPRSDLVGTILADRYLVTAKLGDGGMGQVYLAEHVRMKRKCAVKVMRPGLMNDPDAISRFNREAENASRVIHQNVATVYDFGETSDGMIYLAMEYIEGESLGKVLEREKAIHPIRAAEIVRQAAEALDVAHSHGILHRDLKPENIMITRTRDHLDHVKIVDFGIARAMTSDAQRVTRTGSMVGTPEFMSPEQFAGDVLDSRTDLYSLALVAFNMLTGATAYPSGTSKDNLVIRLTQPPRRLHEVKDMPWPDSLQQTFDKALATDPTMRHATVLDFSREMTAAIASMPASQTGEIYLSALAAALAARASATPSRAATPVEGRAEDRTAVTADLGEVPKPARKRRSLLVAIAAVLGLVAVSALIGKSVMGSRGAAPGGLAAGDSGSAGDSAAAQSAAIISGSSTTAPPLDQDVFNKSRSGVLSIASANGVGLAFLADASGILLAPSHLIPSDSAVTVQIDDATRVRARVLLADTMRAVSVLAIARSRCSQCAPLVLAGADSGAPTVIAGDSIIAIAGVRPSRQRIVKGAVATYDGKSLRTTVRPDASESGAPLLSMGGVVIGMSSSRATGGTREIHASELQAVLAAGQKVAAGGRLPAPSDSLLPVRPIAPFPQGPIAAVAAVAKLDAMQKYTENSGDFSVFVMTPQMLAWREARAREALVKLKASPAGAALRIDKIDPIQAWRSWEGCVRARCAVVVINVVPERTEFLFHKPTEVANLGRNGSVRLVQLLRDGKPVEPIESAYFPAVLNPASYEADRRPVLMQGALMFRPRDFAPNPTGGIARMELLITDAASPSRPHKLTLPPAMIQTVINDFASYGLTK